MNREEKKNLKKQIKIKIKELKTMEYKIKTPIAVWNKEEPNKEGKKGTYKEEDKITVEFKGRDGVLALKEGVSLLAQAAEETRKSSIEKMQYLSKEEKEEGEKERKRNKETEGRSITHEQMLKVVEGSSLSAKIFKTVMKMMESFAKIGGNYLTGKEQDDMEPEDLEGLYEEVLKHFFLDKTISLFETGKK